MLYFNSKALFATTLICGSVLGLKACQNASVQSEGFDTLPPLSHAITCLPDSGALTVAHRGTSKDTALPENSLTGLKSLIKNDVLFSEVDVAGLKDGTHVLFHDGVLDDKSMGSGPIAAQTWNALEGLLLKDTKGNVTSDTIPKLIDYLNMAKDEIYLEIDFKSSAKYDTVIKHIRDADMSDQVILIAYSKGQAETLRRKAPDMYISVSNKDLADFQRQSPSAPWAVWLGSNSEAGRSVDKNVLRIARASTDRATQVAKDTDILVSDYALTLDPVIGLGAKEKAGFYACLSKSPH